MTEQSLACTADTFTHAAELFGVKVRLHCSGADMSIPVIGRADAESICSIRSSALA